VLIDGGYVNPVPFDVVLDKADVTIAVDVIADTGPPAGATARTVPPRHRARAGAIEMMFRSIVREKLKAQAPDILIRPAVGAFSSFDFFRVEAVLAAAEPCREELKQKLSQCLAQSAAQGPERR
jgi:NTE family protein